MEQQFCIALENVLQTFITNPKDKSVHDQFCHLRRSIINIEPIEFRSGNEIPFIVSFGMVEQVWIDFVEQSEPSEILQVVQSALDILTGKEGFMYRQEFEEIGKLRKIPRLEIEKPEWYTQFLDLMNNVLKTHQINDDFAHHLVTAAINLNICTIAGYLTFRIISELIPDEYKDYLLMESSWKRDVIKRRKCYLENWQPDSVKWEKVENYLSLASRKKSFTVYYFCRGWQNVYWSIEDFESFR